MISFSMLIGCLAAKMSEDIPPSLQPSSENLGKSNSYQFKILDISSLLSLPIFLSLYYIIVHYFISYFIHIYIMINLVIKDKIRKIIIVTDENYSNQC